MMPVITMMIIGTSWLTSKPWEINQTLLLFRSAQCSLTRTPANTGAEFYTAVSLESSMLLGGVPDAGTIIWWLKQSPEARSAIASSKDKQLFSGHKTEIQVTTYDRKVKISPTLNVPPLAKKE
ncbi:Uncharacterised protein [Kluyvera cryocrescens]|uniref:3'-5' exoribonuclease Rv2179c-like domain-containing protein n=1 Tax=Kluyvera cryocrescens TaxID=580 RepID=A0A485CW71_KLUCR|nr:Uncharacterised protein [Kluyvera cryocrescens]